MSFSNRSQKFNGKIWWSLSVNLRCKRQPVFFFFRLFSKILFLSLFSHFSFFSPCSPILFLALTFSCVDPNTPPCVDSPVHPGTFWIDTRRRVVIYTRLFLRAFFSVPHHIHRTQNTYHRRHNTTTPRAHTHNTTQQQHNTNTTQNHTEKDTERWEMRVRERLWEERIENVWGHPNPPDKWGKQQCTSTAFRDSTDLRRYACSFIAGKILRRSRIFILVGQWSKITSYPKWQKIPIQHGKQNTDRCDRITNQFTQLERKYISYIVTTGHCCRLSVMSRDNTTSTFQQSTTVKPVTGSHRNPKTKIKWGCEICQSGQKIWKTKVC